MPPAASQPPPESAGCQVAVGLILGSHGSDGSVRVRILSDVPHRFDPGRELYLGGQSRRILSAAFRPPQQVILKLAGLDTPAAARALAGSEVTVPATAAPPLPPGEYFHFQLLGLQVVTETGEDLGRLSEIIVTGSNDVYVVAGPAGETLLPALSQVVRQVDLAAGVMTVRLLEGLR